MIKELKIQVVSGVKWGGLSMITGSALQFVTLAILARNLTPREFGLMAMIVVVISAVQIFSDLGLNNAIIHRQDVTNNHLSSLFWLNIIVGVLLFNVLILTKPFTVLFFKQKELMGYINYAAVIILIAPLNQVFQTLLIKELKYNTLSKIEITSSFVYSIFAIGLALAGFGILSFILGQIARNIATAMMLFIVFRKIWRPKFYLNFQEVKSFLSFGLYQMGERLVNYFRSNIDYIVIGRFLGPVELGYYSLAYQIMVMPLAKISPIVVRVAFPVFSKIQKDNRQLKKGYLKTINYTSLLSFPIMIGMLGVAPELIKLVYGSEWVPAVFVLRIFCITGICYMLSSSMSPLLLAKGKADLVFYWSLFGAVAVSLGVMAGVRWGIVGVASIILFLQPLYFFIMQPFINRLIGFNYSDYLNEIKAPLISSLIMIAGIIAMKSIFNSLELLPLFMLCSGTGVIVYIIFIIWQEKEKMIELRALLKQKQSA